VSVELGAAEADPIAALLVAALIAATATRLIGENANVLMDRTPEEARAAAERAIADVAADIELIRLRLRESAGRYFADVVVAVPPGQAVVEGHRAADLVEAAVQRTLPGSDVVVHVEPRSRDLSLRDRVLAIALEEPLVLEAHDILIFQRPSGVSVALHLKFPADLDLGSAAQIAARVERAISDRLHVAAVQTHLEPLEQTLRARASDQRADAEAEAEIERLVSERTGSPPRHLELLSLENGRVVFLTLGVAAGRSLADAHALAGELEEQLRARVPDIVDVVVRTQP
jgi:divalent metal cation (Fe/Co/Zn/Cd) transporter